MKSTFRYYYIAFITLFLISVSACDNTEEQSIEALPIDLDNVTFVISRGLTASDVNAIPEELIYDWHLVIVDTKGKIEAILSRNDFNDKTDNIPLEKEIVNTKNTSYGEKLKDAVYEGEKYIYAFANMELPVEMNLAGKYIDHNTAMDMSITINGNGFQPTTSNPIPMSHVIQTKLTNELNQQLDIPLYRMLAKVEFTFKSMSDTPITIEEITMNHVTQNNPNNIFLFSNVNDNNLPLVPLSSTSGNYATGEIKDLQDNFLLKVTKNDIEFKTYTMYVNESKKPESEYIGFTLTTRRENGATQAVRYALAESAPGLKRNDFLRIPVTLSDYEFNPRIDFFPPIGGYGQAEISSDPGEVFFVKVKSGGLMTLRPQLYNAATNEPIPDDPKNENPKITIESVAPTTAISDVLVPLNSDINNPVFIEYNTIDGWYNATVNGQKEGKILFTLQYRIADPDHAGNTIILQRKIYLIVES